MTEWVLEARDLRISFSAAHTQVKAVDGVSLAVGPGEAYGLVGPDGAGKTTTMRLLVGAWGHGSGEVRILGQELRHGGPGLLLQVGYLAQRFSLYSELTVQENLEFFGTVRDVRGADLKARSAELLRFVGLTGFEGRQAGKLSGGMKQKLGLACALIHSPRLLLLDEPTTGVDPVTRQDFWQLIIRLLADGVAVVVSTPYMDEAARCNRLGFMLDGRILMQGPPRQLTGLLAGRIVVLFCRQRAVARAVCQADPDVEDVATFGERLHLRLRAGANGGLPPNPPPTTEGTSGGRPAETAPESETRPAGLPLSLPAAAKGASAPVRGSSRGRPAETAPESEIRPAGLQDTLERLRASLAVAGVSVDELATIPPSLEDVFIALKQGTLGG